MKVIIKQVNQDQFNPTFYPIFDEICKALSLINNEKYWMLKTNINIHHTSIDERAALNLLLAGFNSQNITHLQIFKQ